MVQREVIGNVRPQKRNENDVKKVRIGALTCLTQLSITKESDDDPLCRMPPINVATK